MKSEGVIVKEKRKRKKRSEKDEKSMRGTSRSGRRIARLTE